MLKQLCIISASVMMLMAATQSYATKIIYSRNITPTCRNCGEPKSKPLCDRVSAVNCSSGSNRPTKPPF